MAEGFTPGQRVSVDIDGKQVEGIFDRPGAQSEGVPGESPAADASYQRDVGWVRRSDRDELEAFVYERIRPV